MILARSIFILCCAEAIVNLGCCSTITALGNVTKLIETDSEVYSIQHDLFVPGNILLSDSRVIKTTDGSTTWDIVGNPLKLSGYQEGVGTDVTFYGVTSLVQWNSTLIIVVDKWNHCLRFVNRVYNETEQFVGSCTKPGYKDGDLIVAAFFYPTSIVKVGSYLVVADTYNMAIRLIRTDSEDPNYISTLSKGGILKYPQFITSDSKHNMYVAVMDGVVRIEANSRIPQALTSLTGGFADGQISTSRFYVPMQLLSADDLTLIVVDSGNRRIRIIHLETGVVSTLLIVESKMMRSILLTDTSLYIGDYRRIAMVPISGYDATSAKPKNLSTPPLTFPMPTTTPAPKEVDVVMAQYNVRCSVLSSQADTALIRAVTLYRYKQLENISGIRRDVKMKSSFICKNHLLSVYWPIEIQSSGKITPRELRASVQAQLDIQTPSHFSLTVTSYNPPVILPKLVCGHHLRLRKLRIENHLSHVTESVSSACTFH